MLIGFGVYCILIIILSIKEREVLFNTVGSAMLLVICLPIGLCSSFVMFKTIDYNYIEVGRLPLQEIITESSTPKYIKQYGKYNIEYKTQDNYLDTLIKDIVFIEDNIEKNKKSEKVVMWGYPKDTNINKLKKAVSFPFIAGNKAQIIYKVPKDSVVYID